ncbi:2-enoate reductase [Actinomyces sp. Z5]|uniref:oxidoreductase n=1 Tax=Actinomyces sp. Z5 TaxID=2250216 RepID=UPI000DCCD561|nr:FAD-dependent oxidoreductase [Actinomyces sp. Z5]RAX19785.1 2-enoate reductase [Actinomyces sp. Z5]
MSTSLRTELPHAELFEPTRVGSIEVKNHYAMGPMGPLGFSTAEGGWNQRAIEFYTTRARGGIGLIITGVCQVTNPADGVPPGLIPNPTQSPGLFMTTSRDLTERVHGYDAKIVLQAGAGFGRVITKAILGGRTPVAPSAIPYRWDPSITCREMTVEEIQGVVEQFRITGAVAREAGFDGIQVHAVHEGYLLDQFAISFFNHRTDEYGGSLENRLRFAREVVEAIHAGAGDDFPVQLRFSPKSMIKAFGVGAMPGERFAEVGRDIDEGIEAARLLVSYGYQALDVDVGSYDSWYWSHPPMYQAKGLYVPYARQLHEACPDIPLIVAGRMDDPELAAAATADGTATLISLARPTLADPEIVNKLQRGRRDLVRPCISCQEGCIGRIEHYSSLRCAVNPLAARETERPLPQANDRTRMRVLIVGGGVAGMEAARVLAERGHTPVLYEASDRLGGVVIAGGQPSFKEDDLALIAWYERQLEDLGVEVHLNSPVDAAVIRASGADHVLIATGSNPRLLDLGEGVPVVEATDALLDQDALGKQVVIIGGGLTGCELAISLRERGVEVTIVEALSDVLEKNAPLCMANHAMLHDLVPYRGVEVLTDARAERVTDAGLLVSVDGEQRLVPAQTVVTAIGYTPRHELEAEVKAAGIPYHVVGDARRCANIMYAIWDGFEVASQLAK